MSSKTEKRPARSGFCNPSNDAASHDRCRKGDCPCPHHLASAEPLVWEGDSA